jgi:hypothetical protein
MANNLSLNNVLNVSVATPQTGVGNPNTSIIALFTREAYAATFGLLGYKIYYGSAGVGVDFGTASNTFAMATEIFTPQPNILANGGYLVVIPFLTPAQDQQVSVTFPGVPVSGTWYMGYNANTNLTSALTATETAAALQTALQSLTGISSATATGSMAAGFAVNSQVSGVGHPFFVGSKYTYTVTSASTTAGDTYTDSLGNVFTTEATIASQTTLVTYGTGTPPASGTLTKVAGAGDSTITYSAYVTMVDANGNVVNPVLTVTVPGSTGETLDQAIIRTQPLVAYFGLMAAEIASSIITQASARYIQTQNLIGFFVSYTSSDMQSGGMFYQIQSAGLTQSRCLYYDDVTATALGYMAGYASFLLSVNYAGSNTCLTMNLKSLPGVNPDPNITQTIANIASLCGCDIYPSVGGTPKVLCYGANDFADNQTNLQAFALSIRTAYFNALATVNTKIPQTEDGMNTIKGALQLVCEQFVTNGFIAPGVWNNPTTFGNQALLLSNIAQFGYYIYSSPIATQSAADRTARKAPPIQIGIKYAGAEHTGSVVVNVNS